MCVCFFYPFGAPIQIRTFVKTRLNAHLGFNNWIIQDNCGYFVLSFLLRSCGVLLFRYLRSFPIFLVVRLPIVNYRIVIFSFLHLRVYRLGVIHISYIGGHSIPRFAFDSGNTNQRLLGPSVILAIRKCLT